MSHDLTPDDLDFLHTAFDQARHGELPQLLAMLDAGVPVNLTTPRGDTLLILAAYHARPALVVALLTRGADHARVNDQGQTALSAAVFRRQSEIVTDLLDAGADPDLGPTSAVSVARFFDLPDMLTLLGRETSPTRSGAGSHQDGVGEEAQAETSEDAPGGQLLAPRTPRHCQQLDDDVEH